MFKPFLIALCGPIGAGKDTVADYLSDKYGYTKVGFSDPVYQSVWALNPIINLPDGTYRRLQDVVMEQGWETAKRTIPEIRRLLRHMGTEAGRDIHGEDIWARRMKERVLLPALRKHLATEQATGHMVIRDLRFENELRTVHSHSGRVWFVDNGTYDPNKTPEHRSEGMDFTKITHTKIMNTGTFDDLYKRVDEIFEAM